MKILCKILWIVISHLDITLTLLSFLYVFEHKITITFTLYMIFLAAYAALLIIINFVDKISVELIKLPEQLRVLKQGIKSMLESQLFLEIKNKIEDIDIKTRPRRERRRIFFIKKLFSFLSFVSYKINEFNEFNEYEYDFILPLSICIFLSGIGVLLSLLSIFTVLLPYIIILDVGFLLNISLLLIKLNIMILSTNKLLNKFYPHVQGLYSSFLK